MAEHAPDSGSGDLTIVGVRLSPTAQQILVLQSPLKKARVSAQPRRPRLGNIAKMFRPISRLPPLAVALVVLGLALPAAAQAPKSPPTEHRSPSGGPDAGPAPAPRPADPFEPEIRAFEKADRIMGQAHARIVFIGSSSIRLWEGLGFDFPDHYVVNRGFGGSHIADSVRHAERILTPNRPPLVVIYAGSNDIDAGKSPATVAADFKAFAAKVWALFPGTAVAYISIAPSPLRWSEVEQVREANRLIAAICAADKRLTFIDIFPKMLGDDGRPRSELYQADRLHMTRKGYLLWIPAVREVLNAVVPPAHQARTSPRRAD